MKKKILLLISALAIQSPFAATRAYAALPVCPDSETMSLWSALNELSGVIPGLKEAPKTLIALSKIGSKEVGNCSLSMANLMKVMTEIADNRIDQNAINEINENWESAKTRVNEMGNYPTSYY